jgi:hypothetical protein
MNSIKNIFDRVDISSLWNYHLSTFYHYEKQQFYNKKEIPFSDKLLFGLMPILLTIIFCWCGLFFNNNYVNISLTCLSIFVGLLFGLLTLIYGLVQENDKIDQSTVKVEDKRKTEAKINLTKHLFINIAFSIVLSVASIIFILLTQFHPPKLISILSILSYFEKIKTIYLYLTNGISFFLLIEFMLILMMITRRFTVLFFNQFGT